MKNVMQKVMLYLCSLIISLQFHEKIFCGKCDLCCEIVKFDRIDLSGTPCICEAVQTDSNKMVHIL